MNKMMMMMIAVGLAAGVAPATIAPGNDSTETAARKASDVSVGVLLSATRTNEPDHHVLLTSIRVERGLWGTVTNGVIQARYREFMIRAIPEGMSVWFLDNTGSGIEWNAKTNLSYVCFFQQHTNGVSLLRLEPISNEGKVKRAFEESKKKSPQPPSAGDAVTRSAREK
jgi:hypothetical protein